jgi:hypothetical protein
MGVNVMLLLGGWPVRSCVCVQQEQGGVILMFTGTAQGYGTGSASDSIVSNL